MKNKILLILTVVFFVLVNTSYYWEAKLGALAVPAFLLLAALYFVLIIALCLQLYFAVKEKFKQRSRLVIISLLAIVLLTTYFKPLGLIDFDRLEGKNVLVAQSAGAVNCLTTLTLKEDLGFKEKVTCLGIAETKGTFRLSQDTIFFENIGAGRQDSSYYQFAVIKPSTSNDPKILGDLVRYKNAADTIGHVLWITKNELQQLTGKSSAAVAANDEK